MKLKRMTVLFFITALVGILLQGCGSSGSKGSATSSDSAANASASANAGQTASNADTGKMVTLKVWGDLPNQATMEAPFKKINDAFEKENPNIKVQYDFAQNDQSLNVALQSNELPDLFMIQGDKSPQFADMVNNGFILDLTPYNIDTSRFSDMEKAYGTVNGKIYSSLPSFFETNVVYYNKDILHKYGMNVPGTWDDFISLLDTLKAKGVTPIAMAGKSEWDRAWPIFAFMPAFANEAMQKVVDGTGNLKDPTIVQALQYYRGFFEKGYYGKDYVAMDLAAAQFAFTNGKAAMIIDGTWDNTTYVSAGMNLGRFAVPNKEGKRVVQSSYSNSMTYSVSAKTAHPNEAVKYLEFLNSQEAQQIMENSIGPVPTIKDIIPKDEGVKELAQFDVAGLNIHAVLSTVATSASNTADVLMKDVLPKLMTLQINGQQAAEELDKAATYKQ